MADEELARHYYLQAIPSQNLLIKVRVLKSLGTSYWKEAKKLENTRCENFAESIKDLKKQALDRFDQALTYLNLEQMKTEPKETIETLKKNIENNLYKLQGELRKFPKKSTSKNSELPKSFAKFMEVHLKFNKEQQQGFLEYINSPEPRDSESEEQAEQEFSENVSEHTSSNTIEPNAEISKIEEESEQELSELVTDASSPPPLPSAEPPSTPEPKIKKNIKEIPKSKPPKIWNFLGSSASKPEIPQKRTWNLPQAPVKEEHKETEETEETGEAKKETEETQKAKQEKTKYDADFPTFESLNNIIKKH